jgi:hypothetical protein
MTRAPAGSGSQQVIITKLPSIAIGMGRQDRALFWESSVE